MTIDWRTKGESPKWNDTRYGVVHGEDRFRIECTSDAGIGVWKATDLVTGGGFPGGYTACVDWCWQVLESERTPPVEVSGAPD